MAVKAQFAVGVDCLIFTTKTNGDHIEIGPHNVAALHLGLEAATNLASLINSGEILTVIVKKKND